MAFAAPAMAATDGSLVDHNNTEEVIPPNTVLHTVGWAKFATAAGSLECHVTSAVKATGTTGSTGDVTSFTVPDTTKCTGTGLLNGCKLASHTSNTEYHVTVTSNGRLDVTKEEKKGVITITNTFSSCLAKKITLTFTEVQLTPLKTGTTKATGTEGRLGATAVLKETIAGFEIDGTTGPELEKKPTIGVADVEDAFGGTKQEPITGVSGEFELTGSARCTWEIIED